MRARRRHILARANARSVGHVETARPAGEESGRTGGIERRGRDRRWSDSEEG